MVFSCSRPADRTPLRLSLSLRLSLYSDELFEGVGWFGHVTIMNETSYTLLAICKLSGRISGEGNIIESANGNGTAVVPTVE